MRTCLFRLTAPGARLAALACLFVLAGMLGGCGVIEFPGLSKPPVPSAPAGGEQARQPQAVDERVSRLNEGIALFSAGSYVESAVIFRSLAFPPGAGDDVGGDTVRRAALYGLACSRLAGAGEQAQVAEALALLDRWSASVGNGLAAEDPRLLAPGLKGLAASLDKARKQARRPQPNGDRDEAARLRAEAETLRAENERLRKQLAALEELDREMREKKKELSQ